MRCEDFFLVRAGQASVERQHVPVDTAAREQLARLDDLFLSRQKYERVALDPARRGVKLCERVTDGFG